ncbi:hypothetical protein CAAN3_01S09252 [[Candida] anglica]
MLGRLFKQSSTSSLNQPASNSSGNNSHYGPSTTLPYSSGTQHHLHPAGIPNSGMNNSYDDSYMREILYGTTDSSQLQPYTFNNKFFRMVVSQDGGSLRSKQVLYDSSANEVASSTSAVAPLLQRNGSSNSTNSINSKNILTSKLHHNVNDLNDYMFGCGLPTNESQSSTKIHILPTLNNQMYGSNQSVLITRLFSICENLDQPENINKQSENDWHPTSTLPIKETSVKNMIVARRKGTVTGIPNNGNSKLNNKSNSINSRFSIGVIIPIESMDEDISDVIFNNWNEISHYLIILQKFIIKKLINILNIASETQLHSGGGGECPYIINKRIQFPSYVLQNEVDLNNQVLKLIKLIHYNANIPRLINSNNLMFKSLSPVTPIINSTVYNWISEILNWLEFKDGKVGTHGLGNFYNNSSFQNSPIQQNSYSQNLNPITINNDGGQSNTFLASLLALLIPLRDSLTSKPFDSLVGGGQTKRREISRVVIMTGNPMVAKKLIFLINGLIPDHNIESMKVSTDVQASEDTPRKSMGKLSIQSIGETSVDSGEVGEEENEGEEEEDDEEEEEEVVVDNGVQTYQFQDYNTNTFASPRYTSPEMLSPVTVSTSTSSMASPSISARPSLSMLSGARPIPIRSATQNSGTSSPDSNASSTQGGIKGWEIPNKSSISTSTTPGKVSNTRFETDTKVIPIVQQAPVHRSSLSKSSSMAYLSSSLNSSLSSSASNYSLSKLSGSFLEKWKGSFGSGHVTSGSGSGSGNNAANSHMHSSVSGTNSYFPSETIPAAPAMTFGSLNKRVSIHSLRTPSPAIEHDEFLWQHSNNINGNITPVHSSSQGKLSRAQSMLDMYNNVNNTNNYNNSPSFGRRMSVNTISEGARGGSNIKRTKSSIFLTNAEAKGQTQPNSRSVKDNKNIIHSKCLSIMQTKPSFKKEEQNGTLKVEFHTSPANDMNNGQLLQRKTLSPNVGFSDEFRPEFVVQSCPVSPKLESLVMNAMKNDLLFFQNNCAVENVVSKTVFISLRAREIKLIEMSVGGATNGTEDQGDKSPLIPNSPISGPPDSAISASPMNSFYNYYHSQDSNSMGTRVPELKGNSNNTTNKNSCYKTTMKKIYTPQKNCGDKQLINQVENKLNEINMCFTSRNKQDTDEQLARVVLSLLK